jgi:hypothetical protein
VYVLVEHGETDAIGRGRVEGLGGADLVGLEVWTRVPVRVGHPIAQAIAIDVEDTPRRSFKRGELGYEKRSS